jgi:hypothetical protein
MKNLFKNQNNKIQILVIVIVLLLVFLVLCKSRRNKEGFQTQTILQHNNIRDLNANRNDYFKSVRGFKVNKVFEDGIEYEFYEPQNTYLDTTTNQYKVDTTSTTSPTSFTIIKNFLLLVGIYKKNDNGTPIQQNYKIISIRPEDLDVISTTDNFVLYTNDSGNNTRPARRFRTKINLPKVDSTDDKILYYKLGLVTVYKYNNTSTTSSTSPQYIETSNVMNVSNMYIQNNDYMIFLRNSDMENVDKDWSDFQKMKTEQRDGKVVDPDSGQIISTADGEFQYMKSNLGGYPDNLHLQLDTNYNTLNELATNQLSQGILNVNVHTENL